MFFLFSITNSHAFICQDNATGAQVGNDGAVSYISVPLDSDFIKGSGGSQVNEFADINTFYSCYNQAPGAYADFLFMTQFTSALNPNTVFGVQIKGKNYFGSLPGDTLVMEFPLNEAARQELPLKLVMMVKNRPDDGIFVKKDDELLRAKMWKYANYDGNPTPIDHERFDWVFTAANDVILTIGTCDINNGHIIEVDLGALYRSQIAGPGAGQSSIGVKEVPLTYQCNDENGDIDHNYSQKIKMYLSAAPTSFSNTAVQARTGMTAGGGTIIPSLGIEVYHKESNKILAPNSRANGYFNTEIKQGTGSDTLIVAPVQKLNATAEELPAGEFNATGTIIMTTQ